MTNYQQDLRAQYAFNSHCSICNKPLRERDREYSNYKFGKVTCRLHSPLGTPPLSERFNLLNPDQKVLASETGRAEGWALTL